MKTESVPLAWLIPDGKNARKHDEKNLNEVRRSLEQFGQHAPLVVQRGTNRVLIGNGRLEAMKSLGWESADVFYVDDDDEKAIRRALADNRTAELAEWDTQILTALIKDLSSDDLPGWSPKEIDAMLLGDEPEAQDDDFDIAAAIPDEPICLHGDIWMLGKHRLMCGDTTKAEDVAALMAGKKTRIIVTDPPWNVDYGSSRNPRWKNGTDRQILNDSMKTEDFHKFLLAAFHNMAVAAEPGCMTYVVMSAQEWGNLMDVMHETGYHWSSTIIWAKDQLVLSRKDYHTQYEPIFYGWTEGTRLCPLDDRKQSDLWQFQRPKRSDEHPTMKPVPLIARAIQNSSKKGEIVLDLFGGSGTTLVAAEETDRVCYMMELEPKYCDVIIKRWEALTDKKAVLINGRQKT